MDMAEPTVVGLSGSKRDDSYTRRALRATLQAVEDAGGDATLLDTRQWDLPVYDPDRDSAGDADAFRAELRDADSIVLGTPVYHGSYSAPLKNALDYCGFDEFEHTTVGLLCVAGGRFPVTALEHLRTVCRALDAWVIPHQVAIPQAYDHFEGDTITDPDIRERIETLGRDAVQYASIEPDPATFESGENVGAED
jgi:NAD(P)H-dependent FMN reductase